MCGHTAYDKSHYTYRGVGVACFLDPQCGHPILIGIDDANAAFGAQAIMPPNHHGHSPARAQTDTVSWIGIDDVMAFGAQAITAPNHHGHSPARAQAEVGVAY